ncbi:hypothetical protein MTBLM1_70208 [Rhodospirillaceae bacterium LM-1]|nr:hypothetical protein MTBLM1_70208 [Rhodospirillaceae bacterium LM-1]
MPELKDPYLTPITSWCAMLSAICYPDMPEKHAFFLDGVKGLCVTFASLLGFAKPSSKNPIAFTRFAIRATEFSHETEKLFDQDDNGRLWACRILLTFLSLHQHDPKTASFNQVADILMRRHGKNGYGERMLETLWSKYKCVAPLLVAFVLHDKQISAVMSALGVNSEKWVLSSYTNSSKALHSPSEIEAIKSIGLGTVSVLNGHSKQSEKEENIRGTFGTRVLKAFRAIVTLPQLQRDIMATAREITLLASQCYAPGQKALGRPFLRQEDVWTFSEMLHLPAVPLVIPKLSAQEKLWLSGH